jgi:hypothetical protein
VDWAHSSVDHGRTAVYGSMVDHGRRWPKGSPELVVGVALVSGRSPVVGEKKKEASGVPTVGEGGGAVSEGGRRRWTETAAGLSSVWGEWRHGEVKQGVGQGAVGCCSARSSFYRAGGWEGRRCGEGNGRWQSVPLMAFKPSVLGGERRGEWGVKWGQNAAPFPGAEGSSGWR